MLSFARAADKHVTDFYPVCFVSVFHILHSHPTSYSVIYHVFQCLKEAVGGKKFSTNDAIKEAVHRSECFFISLEYSHY